MRLEQLFVTLSEDDPEVIDELFTCLNHTSLSRLWIGFLQYFSRDFPFDQLTVQIRQKATLTKATSSEWSTEKFMFIEDPFELTHNLARGVTQQMAKHIVEIFQIYLDVATSQFLPFTVKGNTLFCYFISTPAPYRPVCKIAF